MLQELSPTEPEALSGLDASRIELWPIDKLIPYARNPRKNDSAVGQMASCRLEFGVAGRAACYAWHK